MESHAYQYLQLKAIKLPTYAGMREEDKQESKAHTSTENTNLRAGYGSINPDPKAYIHFEHLF